MYCSTCGALVPEGRRSCDTCGTSVAPRSLRQAPTAPGPDGRWVVGSPVGQCPRCAYTGEGISYFSRGRHVAALVGATVLTAGAMGAGGLIYYVVRRDHQICPRCGRAWGRHGERAVMRAGGTAGRPEMVAPTGSREGTWRGLSILLFVLAAILLIGGVVGEAAVPLLLSGLAGGGGALLLRGARREREERRDALLAALQLPVLKLAAERRGRLTVTEVAAELGWTLPRAEKVLQSLDDGIRVDSEVTDEGLIVYEFRELSLSPDRLLGPPD